MYSLILMTAMAGTPDAASFGRGTGCGGSAACYGSMSYSYTATYSAGSCCGPAFPRLGGLVRGVGRVVAAPFRAAGCYSSACYGSCYGSGYAAGCYGSCYGSSCYGSSFGLSCFGSCYGSSCLGSAPVIYGDAVPVAPAVPLVPGATSYAPTGEHYGTVAFSGKPTVTVETADAPAAASLSVELPAAAKLYVDGRLVAGAGESRQFHTPALPRGQAFYYEVKAEVEVNGRLEVEEKRVVVKAGESLRESFPRLLASARAAAGPAVASK